MFIRDPSVEVKKLAPSVNINTVKLHSNFQIVGNNLLQGRTHMKPRLMIGWPIYICSFASSLPLFSVVFLVATMTSLLFNFIHFCLAKSTFN